MCELYRNIVDPHTRLPGHNPLRSDARSRPDHGSGTETSGAPHRGVIEMELVWLSRPAARCKGAAEYGSVRIALKLPRCQLIPSPNLAGESVCCLGTESSKRGEAMFWQQGKFTK